MKVAVTGQPARLKCDKCAKITVHNPVSTMRLKKGRSKKPYTQCARYSVNREVLIHLQRRGAEYGGINRALQMSMELLHRFPESKHSKGQGLPRLSGEMIGYTFKVPARTVDQINEFRKQSGFERVAAIIHAGSMLMEAGH